MTLNKKMVRGSNLFRQKARIEISILIQNLKKNNWPAKVKIQMIEKLLHLAENTSIFLSFNTSIII